MIDTCFSTTLLLAFLGVVVQRVVFFDRQPVFFDDEDPEHKSHCLKRCLAVPAVLDVVVKPNHVPLQSATLV